VSSLKVGDHIVTTFIPSCGRCRWCAEGKQNLCDRGLAILSGTQMDGTYRMHVNGVGVAGGAPTFTEWAVLSERSCIPIPADIDLTSACLLGCGVPTGWGSAANAAMVEAGDVVIVIGVGGIGMNAVQGASLAGAARIIAVDPAPFKREVAPRFGATDAVATIEEATQLARELTNGQGADAAIIAIGVVQPDDVTNALASIAKGGIVVLTGVGARGLAAVRLDLFEFPMYQKRIQGALYGMCSPARDIPRLIDLYQSKRLLLDELITRRYRLDDINQGFADMHAGSIIRGVVELNPR
jgi:S-(hydroxymethyl)glutathione dehydrogenase/alcohol dehydrogenase